MTTRSLVSPLSVHWCQDDRQVLVVDERTGCVERLRGFEAAVWKWFDLSYSYTDVLAFSEVFLSATGEAAHRRLDQAIHRWVELGLLAEEVR